MPGMLDWTLEISGGNKRVLRCIRHHGFAIVIEYFSIELEEDIGVLQESFTESHG